MPPSSAHPSVRVLPCSLPRCSREGNESNLGSVTTIWNCCRRRAKSRSERATDADGRRATSASSATSSSSGPPCACARAHLFPKDSRHRRIFNCPLSATEAVLCFIHGTRTSRIARSCHVKQEERRDARRRETTRPCCSAHSSLHHWLCTFVLICGISSSILS